jgi:uncharacterized membrane protein
MFVHFPTALYPAAVVLGLIAHGTGNPTYGRAGAYLLVMGLAGALVAALFGFIDWAGMPSGSAKKRQATRHMIVQLAATLLAAEALVLYFRDGLPSVAAIGVLVVACATMFAGNFLGGVLVYRMAMRVGTVKPPTEAPAASQAPAPSQRERAAG